MMKMVSNYRLVTALIQCFLLTSWVFPAQSESDSLYSPSAPVTQLSATTFNNIIYGSDNFWIVEFYVSWCGHCQNFAPLWTSFAESVKGWKKVIRVAVLSCSELSNTEFCRSMGIHGYPTLRIFEPRSMIGSMGVSFNKVQVRYVSTIQDIALTHISNYLQQYDVSYLPFWSNLKPVNAQQLSTLWVAQKGITFVLVEDDKTRAQRLILEYSDRYPSVVIVWATREEASAAGLKLPISSLALLLPDGTQRTILSSSTELSALKHAIETAIAEETSVSSTTTTTQLIPRDVASTTTATPLTNNMQHRLHMQDVESSLYYSLFIEIPAQGKLTGVQLRTLKKHLNLLIKYLPLRKAVRKYIKSLSLWLADKQIVTSEEWLKQLRATQRRDSFLPEKIDWVGCEGSSERYRGYPCSVWKTFHALTVAAFNQQQTTTQVSNNLRAAQEVLLDMRDYIQNFFGCRYCANHFVNGSSNVRSEVTSHLSAVFWLWRFHNVVNQRLSEDVSEDPQHPKVQFPTKEQCLQCFSISKDSDTLTWQENDVLKYLQSMYGKNRIIQDSKYKWLSSQQPAANV